MFGYKRGILYNHLHPSVAPFRLHLFLDGLQVGRGQFDISRADVTRVHEIGRRSDHRPVNLQMMMTVASSRGTALGGLVGMVLEGTAGEPLQQ